MVEETRVHECRLKAPGRHQKRPISVYFHFYSKATILCRLAGLFDVFLSDGYPT